MVGGRIVSKVRPRLVVRIRETLFRLKELEGLGTSTLTRIAEHMTVEYRRAGESIVRAGEVGERTHVIAQGLAEAKSGDFPRANSTPASGSGESPPSHMPNQETVRVKADLELYTIERGEFLYLMAMDKSLDEQIWLYYMNVRS